MPPGRTQTVVLNGRTLQLDRDQIRRLQRFLLSEVRLRIWMPARNTFDNAYTQYNWHERQARFPFFHWVLEAAGQAGSLPRRSLVSRLKRQRDQLDRSIQPNGIRRFFEQLPAFVRQSSEFRRDLWRYTSRWESGGRRVVRVLTITRDASLQFLIAMTAFYTGGNSAIAIRAGGGAVGAIAESAAIEFLLTQASHSCSRLGRMMAGDQVTTRETLNDISTTAVQSINNAALGELVGRFMRPLKDAVTAQVARELRRGALLRGMTLEFSRAQLDGVVVAVINHYLQSAPRDLRRMLTSLRGNENEQAAAQALCNSLMGNRTFRRNLEQQLRAAAEA